ncbi:MAG: RNA polymerase sigma factor [Labilithrix sp.]|nr:RNA polymerase sigma factor [Labilithrix sp.]MCW5810247.1 RNA polymerase sigma factor [Labilithrix sp.]
MEERASDLPSPLVLLAREAAAGDSAATSKLLRAIAPKLIAVVKAILGAGHADVDDAVQQTLIGFVQGLPAFRGDCDPTGYGRVIAVRTAVAIRKRARARDAKTDPAADADTMAGTASPREDTFARRRKAALRDLLAELPQEQGEAIAMRVVLGFSLEEIASQSGAPLNTVRSRLRLAKERLRARIESDPDLRETLEVQR